MHPAAIGPHRVRKRDVLDNHWKGRLLGFKEKKAVGIVAVVQHVYSLSDIYLPSQNRRAFPINCKVLVAFFISSLPCFLHFILAKCTIFCIH